MLLPRPAASLPIAAALALLSSCCPATSASDPGGNAQDRTTIDAAGPDAWQKLSPSSGALTMQVKSGVDNARARNLKPIVYVGAEWCDPCQAIHRYHRSPKMLDAFQGTYVIELDLDDWKADELKALGYETGSIPVFISVDASGKAKGPTIDGGAWGDNTPENMAPPLKEFFASVS